jgi:hypothetical protein
VSPARDDPTRAVQRISGEQTVHAQQGLAPKQKPAAPPAVRDPDESAAVAIDREETLREVQRLAKQTQMPRSAPKLHDPDESAAVAMDREETLREVRRLIDEHDTALDAQRDKKTGGPDDDKTQS